MATIREYFDTDARAMAIHSDWPISNSSGNILANIVAKVCMNFEANAKYWNFYIPDNVNASACINAIFSMPETARCVLSPDGEVAISEWGFVNYSEKQSSETLMFTRRISIYVDAELGKGIRSDLSRIGLDHGFYVTIYDREYAQKRSALEKPLAFISHDSKDKEGLVRELAHELSGLMCPVWYDEFSLKVGDSLRESIERGLRETKKCIVILSPNFLSNGGWGKAEFDSIFAREILEKKSVILPVWHNVGAQEVFDYSPRLSDKVGLSTSIGIPELARKLSNAIKGSA